MKKTLLLFALVFALTISAFADGQIPIGGKNCPSEQTCRIVPASNPPTVSKTIYDTVFDFLQSMF